MTAVAKIALGTAQFGLDYGVTNRGGQVPEPQAAQILARARGLGIGWLDTASAYGTAEEVLGRLVGGDASFRIGTKVLAAGGEETDPVELAQAQFDASLARLRRTQVDLLMLHDPARLQSPAAPRLHRWLQAQRDAGRVAAIGASFYDGATAAAAVARYPLDWVQLPVSVLDQRALADGSLDRLKSAGVRVQARSALLQGLLLADPLRLPPALAAAGAALARFRQRAAEAGLAPLQAALAFAAAVPQLDQVVLGVESASQLDECAAAFGAAVRGRPGWRDWNDCAVEDLAVIDPRRWPAGVRVN